MFRSIFKTKIEPFKRARSSFFSTDIEPPLDEDNIDYTDILKASFQRSVSPDGMARTRDGKTVAMDKLPTPSKTYAHDHFAYAMDAPTDGNPLSMKPLIEPNSTVPFAQVCWFASQGFIGWQLCAMMAQHWLVDKACTMPARDAMRHGYEVTINEEMKDDGDEEIDQTQRPDKTVTKILAYIKKRDKEFGIRQNCVEFVKFNRVFGIRIALPIIETTEKDYYEKPFNPDGVKPGSYKGISQIDPMWITPELDFAAAANPASIHFYEPTWWRVNGRRIHRTHLVIIRNGQVADVLKPTYLYGGVPVPQKIAERVYAAERTANEAPQLALTKRTTIFKMDIAAALANLTAYLRKMNFFTQNRDNFGVKSIGLDDEAEQFDTSLTDLDATILTQYQIVAAAAEVPDTKLMAGSPKGGLGSEGTYDKESYHEFLHTIQTNDMQPLVERHHLLLRLSEIEPKFKKKFEIEIVWNPCDVPSAQELADVNLKKAQTDGALVDAGALDTLDVRKRLVEDKESGYNGLAIVVPGGPGDRDAEQERRDVELESQKNDDAPKTD